MSIPLANVELSKSVQIYKKLKSLSKNKIQKIFINLSSNKKGNYIINEVNKQSGIGVNTFLMSYKFEEEPSFLSGSEEKEIKYAYLVIIENDNYIFISKKNITGIEKELENYIDYFDYDKFVHFKASDDTKYEKISMGNMTISDAVIRSRSYEADNLNGIMPLTSSSRSVPRNIRINQQGDTFSITPNSSRIGQRSTKVKLDDYISWCLSIISDVESDAESEFINGFANPINLKDIMDDSSPIGILFHFYKLENEIENGIRDLYYFDQNSQPHKLENDDLKKLFITLRKIFHIEHVSDSIYKIQLKGRKFGELKINNKSISLKNSQIEKVYLDNQGQESILKFINENKNYTIIFDKPKYAYIGKYAFSDKQLLTQMNINKILSICETNNNLLNGGDIDSEKCKPGKNATLAQKNHFNSLNRFPSNSLFYRVEENFNNGILICDDMGNEWADHIYIDENSISFIHSKFVKKDKYSASAMHEVVSQALKNIGRVNASIKDYEIKYNDKWCKNYESTNICRLRKDGNIFNSFSEIKDLLERVYSKTNSKKRIYLATPFFSKNSLDNKLQRMLTSSIPNSHLIQLVWLLSSFISSCQDYGIEPYILCKD
jgi:hypothetical protein